MNRSSPCECFRESIALLGCGALSETERARVESHVAQCSTCQEYQEAISQALEPFTTWEQHYMDIRPTAAMEGRWKRAIEAAAVSSCDRAGFGSGFVRTCIQPYRFLWGTLAALWIGMAAINFSLNERRPAVAEFSDSPAVLKSWQEQRRVLAELLPADPDVPAEGPRPVPRPRSDYKIGHGHC